MTSWIKNTSQKKRISRNIEEKNNQITDRIQRNNYTTSYIPYLFDYNEGKILINTIREFSLINLTNVKKIVNVYQPYYKNNMPASGLGDYIRGSIFLYQYCKIADIECEMNMNNHMINTILDNEYSEIKQYYLENIEHSLIVNYHPNINKLNDTNIYVGVINSVNAYLSKCMIDENGVLYVCMKPYPIFKITDDERQFIKNNLKYNKIFENDLNKHKNNYNLSYKGYNTIHIRSGDKYLIQNNTISSDLINTLNNIIDNYMKNNKDKIIILIGDSNSIINNIIKKYPRLINFNNIISHMGEGVNNTYDSIKNNMIEFYIMSESASIYSISSYNHGSGFSKWSAEINNIPYTGGYII
jgi:hypothetical protein